MFDLNLPPAESLRIRHDAGHSLIYDSLRQRYVALTPEEWVRQHFVNFLIAYKGYPKSLIANEVSLRLASVTRRVDTVVYNRDLTPLMIIEYKAPNIQITQQTFRQITNYDRALHAKYLTLSNGLKHFCLRVSPESTTFLSSFPTFDDL